MFVRNINRRNEFFIFENQLLIVDLFTSFVYQSNHVFEINLGNEKKSLIHVKM